MVGRDGGVFAFGDAGFVGSLPGLNVHVNNIVGAVPTSDGKGYWMVGRDGGVFAFGDAGFVGSLPGLNVHVNNIVAVVPTADGQGLLDGRVRRRGVRLRRRRLRGLAPRASTSTSTASWEPCPRRRARATGWSGPTAGCSPSATPASWARCLASTSTSPTSVGVVATSDNQGYWMVGNDGGVFAFGDAAFLGSIPNLGLHVSNIVAFARQ